MFVIQLLIDMFRRPFAYLGLAMITLAFIMGWNAVVGYHSMPLDVRESYLLFASSYYFLGFMTLAAQVVMDAAEKTKKLMAGLICAGNCVMALWVLIGPFVGRPFLGLAPFTLPL